MDRIQRFLTCPNWEDTHFLVADASQSSNIAEELRDLHLAWHSPTANGEDLLRKVEKVADLIGDQTELAMLLSTIKYSLHSRYDYHTPGTDYLGEI